MQGAIHGAPAPNASWRPLVNKAHILELIASSHGGGASHVLDLATFVPQERFRITVGMPQDGGNVTKIQIEQTGARFLSLNIHAGLRLAELNTLRRFVRDERVDLIHIHGARAGFYGRMAAMTLHPRPKIAFSLHDFTTPHYSTPKKEVYLGLEYLFQRVTDHTFFVSNHEKQSFLSYGFTTEAKTSIVPPGISLARFRADQFDREQVRASLHLSDEPVILMMCRFSFPRDFETLLTAVWQTKHHLPNVKLLIVGDGPLRDTVEKQIAALGLEQTVTLLGYRQDIPQLLTAADICTLTSSSTEGFPISTLEAQAMGRPVVITDAGGSSEAVLHNKTGLVVPIKDPTALANAFVKLLMHEPLKTKLGQQGIVRAETSLSSEAMTHNIVATYDMLLAEP